MADVVVFVEDKNDVIFLRDFILKNYCNSEIANAKYITEKEYKITVNNKSILVADTNKGNTEEHQTGGWAKLKGQINSNFFVKQKQENENVRFVILFDADEDKTDNIAKKNTDIDSWLNGKDFEIDRFYLPFNNEKSHNLEQLLELSFKQEMNGCWEEFTNCLVNEKNPNAIPPTSKKGKIVTYKDIYSTLANKKNEYLSDLWDLDFDTNNNLKPLKEFLDQYLK
ncbi:hypothetical protein V3Q90_02520 [Flavobacterium oreochromis]|uniref:hypothetical protein n=1 Tax=Flavobacterium oreochromis TaxID=2906078 RepID=UPI00385EB181